MWLHSNTARISFRKRATLQQPATSLVAVNMSHNNHDPTVGVWCATDAVEKADPVLDNNHHSFQYPVKTRGAIIFFILFHFVYKS